MQRKFFPQPRPYEMDIHRTRVFNPLCDSFAAQVLHSANTKCLPAKADSSLALPSPYLVPQHLLQPLGA
jgi:hypothetical protein